MKNVQIYITGRVQGVGFRYSALQKARELHIAGFVKNERDRSVFIEAEGTEENVDQMVLWCHKGPSFARVENVRVMTGLIKNYTTFTIRH